MGAADTLGGFEIYIPEEAEVKTFPLKSLPNSTLRRLGLSQDDIDCSKNKPASPDAIWISPMIIRERDGPERSHAGDTAKANMTSLVGIQQENVHGPFFMPFVSSNCIAFRVLGEFRQSRRSPRLTIHSSLPSLSSLQGRDQDAVIVYSGRIYLLIRRPKERRQGQRHASSPNVPATPIQSLQTPPMTLSSCTPSASKRQIMSSPESSELEDNDFMEERILLKRRCLARQVQVSLPKLDLKSLGSKTQELVNDTGPKNTSDGDKHDIEKELLNEEADAASSNTSLSTSPPSEEQSSEEESVESCHLESDGEQVEDNDPMDDTSSTSSHEGEVETLGHHEAGDGGEVDIPVGVTEDDNVSSWSSELFMTPKPVLHQDFDFEQLAQEEMIARMQAKLRASEAALNNLRPSK